MGDQNQNLKVEGSESRETLTKEILECRPLKQQPLEKVNAKIISHCDSPPEKSLEKKEGDLNDHKMELEKKYHAKKLRSSKKQGLTVMENKPKKRMYECQTCNENFCVRWEFKLHLSEHPQGNILLCKLCQKKFQKPSELQNHLRSHSGAKPFQCEVCGMSFMGKNTLRKHEHIHSTNKSEFHCEICKKTFSRKQYLQEHKRTHTGSKPFQCKICLKSFVGKTGLNHHMKTHKSTDEKKCAVCEVCGKSFTRHALWTHMKHHIKEHKCEFCSKCFATSAALKTHVAGTHLGHSWHNCNTCGKGFVRKGHLSRHIKTHEQDKKTMLVCSQCPSKFKNEVHLKAHTKRKHSQQNMRSPSCGICGKHFSTQSAVSYHQRLHFHERPHRCNICGKTFAMPYQLRDHIRLHHSDEKLFSCQVCARKCATQALLNRHLLTHKPTFTPMTKPPGSFMCVYCDKIFTTKLALSNHSRIHAFSRPYHCNVCKKAFRYQDSLLKHLRLHPNNSSPDKTSTKELPCIYTIQVCRPSFAPTCSNIIGDSGITGEHHCDIRSNETITTPTTKEDNIKTTDDNTLLCLKPVEETYLSQTILQSNEVEYISAQTIEGMSIRNVQNEKPLDRATHSQRPFSITIDGNLCCNSRFSIDGGVTHSISMHSQRIDMEIPDVDISVPSHILLPANLSSSVLELPHLQVPLPSEQTAHDFDGTLACEFSL